MSVRFLPMKISQRARENFRSYRKTVFCRAPQIMLDELILEKNI